jgi:2-polyprenyl-6-methoxyphenol hydroxylase-like FAD-dependent oxidoreductase
MNTTENITPVAIVGGGIGGLALALHLHRLGQVCEVFEAVPQVREIGVGITLLPHAMRELAALGLAEAVEAAGIVNYESVFYTRHGQFIYRELRGRHAGYPQPEVSIHRGKLHQILWQAAVQRLGLERVHTGHRFARMVQQEHQVTLHFDDPQGQPLPEVRSRVVVAADGVNSAVRRVFYPDEKVAFNGINTWRGVTRHSPILTGKSYMRVGSIDTGKMVIYPIADNIDGQGTQLINWVAEIGLQKESPNDWNRPGRLDDVLPLFKDWNFDWLNVPELIANAESILEYPMVDKDPIAQWTFGRVTLLGDAAHPMYPRGSNGSAQALVDARTLADELTASFSVGGDPIQALGRYEAQRRPVTSQVVLTNRSTPPDFINIKVDELTGGQPFRHIDDVISQDELRKISDDYKKIAGFSLAAMAPQN